MAIAIASLSTISLDASSRTRPPVISDDVAEAYDWDDSNSGGDLKGINVRG
jgi:hypothetical protein